MSCRPVIPHAVANIGGFAERDHGGVADFAPALPRTIMVWIPSMCRMAQRCGENESRERLWTGDWRLGNTVCFSEGFRRRRD